MEENFIPQWRVKALWGIAGAIFLFAILSAGFGQPWLLILSGIGVAALCILEIRWLRCPVCGRRLNLWLVTYGMREGEVRCCPYCGDRIDVR